MKKTRLFSRAASLCVAAVLFVFLLAVPALAAVPDRPDNQYVLDEADVLSAETEREIIEENTELFEETGAQIVIAAVDFLGGQEIDDYTYEMFNHWGVGSSERNNGLLLVLAIGEDNYYAMPGYGIEDHFTGGRLQTMLDEYLEPAFAAGDYDAGVRVFFGEALAEMERYYEDYTDEYTQGDYQPGGANEDFDAYYDDYDDDDFFDLDDGFWRVGQLIGLVVRVIIIVVVVLVFVLVIRAITRGGRGGGGSAGGSGSGFLGGLFLGSMMSGRRTYWHRHPPPPPPPGPGGPRPGGFGGFGPRPGGAGRSSGPRPRSGGFGGFSGGGRSGGGGGFRGGSRGGFSGGGRSRGGGAGRR